MVSAVPSGCLELSLLAENVSIAPRRDSGKAFGLGKSPTLTMLPAAGTMSRALIRLCPADLYVNRLQRISLHINKRRRLSQESPFWPF